MTTTTPDADADADHCHVYGSSMRWTLRTKLALWLLCIGQRFIAQSAPDVGAQLLIHLDQWADQLPERVRPPVATALWSPWAVRPCRKKGEQR